MRPSGRNKEAGRLCQGFTTWGVIDKAGQYELVWPDLDQIDCSYDIEQNDPPTIKSFSRRREYMRGVDSNVSIGDLQRMFRIGYSEAAKLLQELKATFKEEQLGGEHGKADSGKQR